jgi:molecular chaperone IbpA
LHPLREQPVHASPRHHRIKETKSYSSIVIVSGRDSLFAVTNKVVGPHTNQEIKMTKLTTLDLTPFYRNSIGIDRLFDRIVNQIDSAASTNYPPYDIVRTGDETYEIRVAVAGFVQADIDVEFNNGTLIVKGEKATEVGAKPEVEYIHHGISGRSFIRTFSVAEYVEVQDAVLADGILTVKLERLVPESQRPKKIAVSYQPTLTA